MTPNSKELMKDEYVYRGIELPCDVRLPPATTIRAGCTLETLLLALELEGRPRHFASVDGRPKDGDAVQHAAPLATSAVPNEDSGDAQ